MDNSAMKNLSSEQQELIGEIIQKITDINNSHKKKNHIEANRNSRMEDDFITKEMQKAESAAQEGLDFISEKIASSISQYNETRRQEEVEEAKRTRGEISASTRAFMNSVTSNYSNRNEINARAMEEDRLARKLKYELEHLKLMTTKQLIKADYESESLQRYIEVNKIDKNAFQNNFKYKDRDMKSSVGLKYAVIIYGTIHYICTNSRYEHKDELLGAVKSELIKQLRRSDKTHQARMALGILEAYDNGQLEYDTLPEVELLKQAIEKYDDPEVIKTYMETVSDAEDSSDDIIETEQKTYDRTVYESVASQALISDGIIKPRQWTKVVRIDEDKVKRVIPDKKSAVFKFRSKLFESRNGVSYSMKKYWDMIIEGIAKQFPDTGLVTKFAIYNDTITVNGQPIVIDSILDTEYNINISDIARVREVFKKFRYIQTMMIDEDIEVRMIEEFNYDEEAIIKIFNENKVLKELIIVRSSGTETFNRKNIVNKKKEMKEKAERTKWKTDMELEFASKNPRVGNKPAVYKNRIWEGSKSVLGKSWKAAMSNLNKKDPSLIKFIGFSGISLAVIGIGGIASLIGAIPQGIKRLTDV